MDLVNSEKISNSYDAVFRLYFFMYMIGRYPVRKQYNQKTASIQILSHFSVAIVTCNGNDTVFRSVSALCHKYDSKIFFGRANLSKFSENIDFLLYIVLIVQLVLQYSLPDFCKKSQKSVTVQEYFRVEWCI